MEGGGSGGSVTGTCVEGGGTAESLRHNLMHFNVSFTSSFTISLAFSSTTMTLPVLKSVR